jgi:fucose 4-O-acetylase-like acetyltransferase
MTILQSPTAPKEWIDALKGIGIVAVVLGHAFGWRDGSILPLIYLFHMPLFFFLSGYLYKPSPDLWVFMRKKTFHLLVPYAAFLLLVVVLPEIYRAVSVHHFRFAEAKYIVKNAVYGGRRLEGDATAFWFVPCLFLTQQIFNFLVVRGPRAGLLPIILAATVLSYVNSLMFQHARLPLNANVVLAALPLFYLGYVFKRYENRRWITVAAFAASIAAVALVLCGMPNFYDMKVAEYGIPVLTMASAIAVTIALIAVAKQLPQVSVVCRGFVALGQASMVIMFVHQAVFLMRAELGSNNRGYGIVLAIVVSYLVYVLAKRFAISRAVLLGSESDFRQLLKLRGARGNADPVTATSPPTRSGLR